MGWQAGLLPLPVVTDIVGAARFATELDRLVTGVVTNGRNQTDLLAVDDDTLLAFMLNNTGGHVGRVSRSPLALSATVNFAPPFVFPTNTGWSDFCDSTLLDTDKALAAWGGVGIYTELRVITPSTLGLGALFTDTARPSRRPLIETLDANSAALFPGGNSGSNAAALVNLSGSTITSLSPIGTYNVGTSSNVLATAPIDSTRVLIAAYDSTLARDVLMAVEFTSGGIVSGTKTLMSFPNGGGAMSSGGNTGAYRFHRLSADSYLYVRPIGTSGAGTPYAVALYGVQVGAGLGAPTVLGDDSVDFQQTQPHVASATSSLAVEITTMTKDKRNLWAAGGPSTTNNALTAGVAELAPSTPWEGDHAAKPHRFWNDPDSATFGLWRLGGLRSRPVNDTEVVVLGTGDTANYQLWHGGLEVDPTPPTVVAPTFVSALNRRAVDNKATWTSAVNRAGDMVLAIGSWDAAVTVTPPSAAWTEHLNTVVGGRRFTLHSKVTPAGTGNEDFTASGTASLTVSFARYRDVAAIDVEDHQADASASSATAPQVDPPTFPDLMVHLFAGESSTTGALALPGMLVSRVSLSATAGSEPSMVRVGEYRIGLEPTLVAVATSTGSAGGRVGWSVALKPVIT